MQLQKEVKSNPKQPNCKKSVQPSRRPFWNMKSKVVAKKLLDSRLMEKILIMTIQVNLVPNPTQIHVSLLRFLPLAQIISLGISHLLPSWGLHTLIFYTHGTHTQSYNIYNTYMAHQPLTTSHDKEVQELPPVAISCKNRKWLQELPAVVCRD